LKLFSRIGPAAILFLVTLSFSGRPADLSFLAGAALFPPGAFAAMLGGCVRLADGQVASPGGCA
jgi:hypothetical protein